MEKGKPTGGLLPCSHGGKRKRKHQVRKPFLVLPLWMCKLLPRALHGAKQAYKCQTRIFKKDLGSTYENTFRAHRSHRAMNQRLFAPSKLSSLYNAFFRVGKRADRSPTESFLRVISKHISPSASFGFFFTRFFKKKPVI